MANEELKRIVLLIDADNTQLSKLEAVVNQISLFGRIVVKRAYGNWKKDELKHWEDELKRLAIKAEQQFDYTAKQNATDMALVIDAMDLLHENMYDAFVIVASDSDYTPLAIKLREAALFVVGVGKAATPEPFRAACNQFILLENLPETEKETKRNVRKVAKPKVDPLEPIHELIRIAANEYQDEDGYLEPSRAVDYIKRARPDFDLTTYGFKQFSKLLEAYPNIYELKRSRQKGEPPLLFKLK